MWDGLAHKTPAGRCRLPVDVRVREVSEEQVAGEGHVLEVVEAGFHTVNRERPSTVLEGRFWVIVAIIANPTVDARVPFSNLLRCEPYFWCPERKYVCAGVAFVAAHVHNDLVARRRKFYTQQALITLMGGGACPPPAGICGMQTMPFLPLSFSSQAWLGHLVHCGFSL